MASFLGVLKWAALLFLLPSSRAKLSDQDFYSTTCPNVYKTVKNGVYEAMQKDTRMGASLLRLFYHDCFVQGCDASVLLDDTDTLIGEKTAISNKNSARGFQVIDAIKSAVEEQCPGVVSCADILAIAARDSVVQLGGPSWDMTLGRRDAKTASFVAANEGIPLENWTGKDIIARANRLGLSTRDYVALLGSHGLIREEGAHTNIQTNNETEKLKLDNMYFQKAQTKYEPQDYVAKMGLASSPYVLMYAEDKNDFFRDFTLAMVKLGNISPLTGSYGEVRKNCSRVN